MGVNKVEYYGETLIDTTGTTVSEDTLMEGETAINAAGEKITGQLRAVEYKAQNPTAEEQAQARKNIDALGTEELPEAINTALTQAKESGEFDGRDGQDGQDGKDGSDGIGIETIQQVTISSADGAKNVWRMTLTNGQTADFVVENGAKGSDGKSAYEIAKAAGFTGTKEEFGDMLYNAISGLHEHRWNQIIDRPFGDFPTEEGTDTVTSDDVVYTKLHRVSEFIPTLEDLQKGGSISYYRVSGGAITGSLETINFPEGYYTIGSSNNGLMISSDGVPMVIVSFNGKPQFGAITFSDITEPGVYFDQGKYGKCIHSLTINGYDGFKFYEARPIPKKYLPEDIGAVKTVNNIAPDENGNINIECSGESSGGGSSKADSAFDLIRSDTLTWNGDTEGKVVAVNTVDPSLSYVRVSSLIPTLAELQKGGSYATTGADGIPYEQPFTSENIVDSDTLINCFDGYVLIAKEDGASFVDEYTNCALPKAGIYYAYFGAEGYTSKLTITDYTGFAKPILKMDSLTPHGHDWYGKTINKGNTVRSDDVVHGGYVKVSDAVPTEAELRKGGTIRHYNVADGKLSGDLIVGNYLDDPYSISVLDEAIVVFYGVEVLVVISINGSSNVGALVIDGITSPGVYFQQGKYSCTHSLTINEYTGFNYNLEKVPAELLPDNTGGGVSSWSDLTDKPFGETTVMGDTLTWDGDMTGKEYVQLPSEDPEEKIYYVKISDAVPTLEDLQNGCTLSMVQEGQETVIPLTAENFTDIGNAINFPDGVGIIAKEDNVDLVDFILPTKGIYVMGMAINGETLLYISALTINNYTGFEMEVVKTIDPKYLPNDSSGDTSGNGVNATFTIESAAVGNIAQATVTCDKSLESLLALSLDELSNARILWDVAGTGFIAKPISAQNMSGIVVLIGFACVTINGLRFYYIGYNAEGLTVTEVMPATS